MSELEIQYLNELEIQREIIKRQQRQLNDLRRCNHALETTNQLLADALDAALRREGRDRVFVSLHDKGGATFRPERTIDGDLLFVWVK